MSAPKKSPSPVSRYAKVADAIATADAQAEIDHLARQAEKARTAKDKCAKRDAEWNKRVARDQKRAKRVERVQAKKVSARKAAE